MPEPEDFLAAHRPLFEQALDRHLPRAAERPAALHEAMRYALFPGGKRLRPMLTLAAAEATGGDAEAALRPALAVEALHAYTLIHDDLPCMDDDAVRRGRPTVHVRFGEAMALLAGDALLTLALEWTAEIQAPPPYLPNQLTLELAEAAGSRGLIAGQVEDLAAEGQPPNADRVLFIHLHKTASLIRAAVRLGAIAAGAKPADLDALTVYGADLGLAFQIADDVLNATADPAVLGKPAGTDRRAGKMTYPAVFGLDGAREKARELADRATAALEPLSGDTDVLAAFARLAVERTH